MAKVLHTTASLLNYCAQNVHSSIRNHQRWRALMSGCTFQHKRLYGTSQTQTEEDDVLFESINGKGVITLNRPDALNALTLSMVNKIQSKLQGWETSHGLVIIKGSGSKAFCAGGDLVKMLESVQSGKAQYSDYFCSEFGLCAFIKTLRVPYIALIDGVTMGSGAGLSVHGAYRIATEHTIFAMPETRIGFFPDNGAGYFLSRMAGKLGLYLALTGNQLRGGDVFRAGFATHVCDRKRIKNLELDLLGLDSCETPNIEKVLMKYHHESEISRTPFTLATRLKEINSIFDASCVEDILTRLEQKSKSEPRLTKWASEILKTLLKSSPTSLKITFRLMELGATLSLQEVLNIELGLGVSCTQHNNLDVFEGIRALLVDKDKNPQWNPKMLQDVRPETIHSYFRPYNRKLNFRD